MRKQNCTANAGKGGHVFTLFLARLRARSGVKLFSIEEGRPLTPSEILGTPEGVRLFASWAPETKLFSRKKSSGEESVI